MYLHTIIQKLHYDYIIISAFGDSVIAPLTFIDDNFLWYETTSGTLRVLKKFNNNKTSDDYGTPNAYQPSSGSSAIINNQKQINL